MSKETFKEFARKHPELASHVLSNNISWQQLYELYEIYGENNKIWNNYLNKEESSGVKDIVEIIKNIDLIKFQEGISNIQKTISVIQNLTPKEPQPLYKRFE